ncbi:MAG: ABC transporter permease, partial [Balneolaceae bacterium]|nr:ABC transporter permease [Balneolaceae bacterium]
MFNLEQAIQSWKKSLKSSPAFEEGQVQEMETHLRDRIDQYLKQGISEEKAFKKAAAQFGPVEEIGDEVYKTKSTGIDATPPWKQKSWIPGMLPNYLKIALRNITGNKLQSAINILGLAVGLACCILIYMFVRQQFSYDTFHENSQDIYLLTYQEIDRPGARYFSTTSPPMGPNIQQEFPEVKHALRLRDSQNNVFTYRDKRFYEQNIFYADSTFFEVFSFPLAIGNPKTALNRPGTVVLTAETARKYFGNENPIGRELILDGERSLEVTGVLKPIPAHTHLPLSLLISFETFRVPAGYPVTLNSWEWVSFHTYLRLQEGTDPEQLESKLPGFLQKHRSEEMAARGRLLLQPVTDIYLSEEPRNEIMRYGNANYAYGLGAIAVMILLIAGFNFMNISTAQSLKRGKEAGIRKVLGSNRGRLTAQFLGESVIKALMAFFVAIFLVGFTDEYFSGLFGFELTYNSEILLLLTGIFLFITLFVGIGAGLYPALKISNFKPGEVLKGKLTTSRSSLYVRNALMTMQFAISIGLIIGSLVISGQIRFLQSKELGFDQEQTIVLKVVREQFEERY